MLPNERNSLRLRTAFAIGLEFIGNDLIADRSSLSIGERLDVHKDLGSAVIRRDETEAFVIFPSGDSSLIAHMTWLM